MRRLETQSFKDLQPYLACHRRMVDWTLERDERTLDALWFLEHEPVFTLGQAGSMDHVLRPGDIPVVQSDRGGQVTYHGPGQWVMYALFDLTRLSCGIRDWITLLEQSVVTYLSSTWHLNAYASKEAPGVYLHHSSKEALKVGSLGLRVKKGRVYHGIALNAQMDLEPFHRIHPCGFKDMEMTQLSDWVSPFEGETARRHFEQFMESFFVNRLSLCS